MSSTVLNQPFDYTIRIKQSHVNSPDDVLHRREHLNLKIARALISSVLRFSGLISVLYTFPPLSFDSRFLQPASRAL